jgi:hypothetical protein
VGAGNQAQAEQQVAVAEAAAAAEAEAHAAALSALAEKYHQAKQQLLAARQHEEASEPSVHVVLRLDPGLEQRAEQAEARSQALEQETQAQGAKLAELTKKYNAARKALKVAKEAAAEARIDEAVLLATQAKTVEVAEPGTDKEARLRQSSLLAVQSWSPAAELADPVSSTPPPEVAQVVEQSVHVVLKLDEGLAMRAEEAEAEAQVQSAKLAELSKKYNAARKALKVAKEGSAAAAEAVLLATEAASAAAVDAARSAQKREDEHAAAAAAAAVTAQAAAEAARAEAEAAAEARLQQAVERASKAAAELAALEAAAAAAETVSSAEAQLAEGRSEGGAVEAHAELEKTKAELKEALRVRSRPPCVFQQPTRSLRNRVLAR